MNNLKVSYAKRLWSLWEIMQRFKVEELLSTVRTTINSCSLIRDDHQIQDGLRQHVVSDFNKIFLLTQELNLVVANKQTENILKVLALDAARLEGQMAQRAIAMIAGTIETEISTRLFFVVQPELSKFFDAQDNFGKEVSQKFPQAMYDIDEAGKCFALNRYTASVFHLMRAMEIAVKGMSRCLGIPDPIKPSERNWGVILRKIKEEMDVITKGTTKRWPNDADRAFFEDAYASLDAVRNAWRNTTMHVENKYTDEDADNIYRSVRFFIRKLASRFDETGEPKIQ